MVIFFNINCCALNFVAPLVEEYAVIFLYSLYFCYLCRARHEAWCFLYLLCGIFTK